MKAVCEEQLDPWVAVPPASLPLPAPPRLHHLLLTRVVPLRVLRSVTAKILLFKLLMCTLKGPNFEILKYFEKNGFFEQ